MTTALLLLLASHLGAFAVLLYLARSFGWVDDPRQCLICDDPFLPRESDLHCPACARGMEEPVKRSSSR